MGPNNKKRSRKQYVKYRLQILRECEAPLPPKDVIEKMMDESAMSEVEVDNICLGCIMEADEKGVGW